MIGKGVVEWRLMWLWHREGGQMESQFFLIILFFDYFESDLSCPRVVKMS